MNKKEWFKSTKARLAATVTAAIAAIVAAGLIFDWRYAVGVLAAEILACLAYSLRKLHKKKEEGGAHGG